MAKDNIITLYKSGDTSDAPTVNNLAYGELAINYNDEYLFYKNSGDALRTIPLEYLIGISSAVQTQLDAKVATTGNETIAGVKTFSSVPVFPNDTIETADIQDNAVTAAKLAHTAVTAGSYTIASITVDAQGRITAASSGSSSAYDGDIGDLDIDGANDIGADIVDADLFIVDDGAGGTNRKTAASRIKDYVRSNLRNDLSIGETDPVTFGHLTVGADSDGSDRTITFGHSTLKTIMGIDDGHDVFAINTDDAFEGSSTGGNDFEIDASGNVFIGHGNIKIANGEVQTPNIGYSDGTNAMVIGSSGVVTFPQRAVFSSGLELNDSDILVGGLIRCDRVSGVADGNTFIDYGPSDVITFKTGGSTAATFNSSQLFTASAGITSTAATNTFGATTFSGDVTAGSNSLTATGSSNSFGATSFNDANITNVGSIALDTITNDGTDITLDSSNDIVIDADGGNIEFKDGGTAQLTIDMDGTAGDIDVNLMVDGDDLVFNQYDGTEVFRIKDNAKMTGTSLSLSGSLTADTIYGPGSGAGLTFDTSGSYGFLFKPANNELIIGDSAGNDGWAFTGMNGSIKYITASSNDGSSGYGFRDNNGTMQVKNSGGSWANFGAAGGEANVDAYSYVAVSGQTTCAADAAADTLTFVAGSNMTITTSGDSITFAASAGGSGDIEGVTAGTGLSGGGTSGTVSLSTTNAQGHVTSVGALDGGSITSGFGGIDNGTSGIRSDTLTAETYVAPDASGGATLGTTSLEWGDVYIADDKKIYLGNGQDVSLEYDEDGTDQLRIAGSTIFENDVTLGADSDGTDRTITFGHSTLKTIMGIDDSQDVFAINTDGSFESQNDLEIDASGNVQMFNGYVQATELRGDSLELYANSGTLTLSVSAGNIDFDDGGGDGSGTTQLRWDLDSTAGQLDCQLKVDGDDLVFKQYDGNEVIRVADDRKLYFYDQGGESIHSDGSYLYLTSGGQAFRLPTSGGSNGQQLTTDGSGNLSWAAAGSSGGGEDNEYSFKTISVSGQSDVVADTTTDTLTLVAAGGMTITTSGDTITLNSANDNTTYSSFAGSTTPGTAALVPARDAGNTTGKYLREDGDWVVPPDTDNNTTYSAGTGLSLSSTTFSVDASQTQITSVGTIGTGVWQGTAIASGYIAADAITGAKIADDAIDSEHYTDGSIDHAHLSNDCIDGDNIQNDVINSEHYAAGSIDEEHLNCTNSPSDNQILSYNAAGSNFTWVDDDTGSGGGGSGTVNSGTATAFAQYASTGTAVSDTITSTGSITMDLSGNVPELMLWREDSTVTGTNGIARLEMGNTDYSSGRTAPNFQLQTQSGGVSQAAGSEGGCSVLFKSIVNGSTSLSTRFKIGTDGEVADDNGDPAFLKNMQLSPGGTGTILINQVGAGAYTFDVAGSDERIKHERRSFDYGLKEIEMLKPEHFKYNKEAYKDFGLSEHDDKHFENDIQGLMAQDVEKIMPELVYEHEAGIKNYRRDGIVSALVNAVKELSARVAELEAK